MCLHGWGGSKESFSELREALKGSSIEVLTPDLPGFGQEPEPRKPWSVDDYADWVENWLKHHYQLSTTNYQLHILGHSHGGRIAMKLAARKTFPIAHLFLCAPAGIRRPRHLKRILGLILAKTGKFFLAIPGLRALKPLGRALLYSLVRVHDYERASPLMRATLMRVTREDLRPVLGRITVPTDIFWGTADRMTPIADAHVIHAGIKGSRLHTFKGTRHNVHCERAREIAEVIFSRWRRERCS